MLSNSMTFTCIPVSPTPEQDDIEIQKIRGECLGSSDQGTCVGNYVIGLPCRPPPTGCLVFLFLLCGRELCTLLYPHSQRIFSVLITRPLFYHSLSVVHRFKIRRAISSRLVPSRFHSVQYSPHISLSILNL
jgi:hypothetical protein